MADVNPVVAYTPKGEGEKVDYSELLKEARDRFDRNIADDKDNKDSQRTDTLFVYSPGRQWPDNTRRERELNKEVCLEFNQLKQFVAQVVNDQRQNRPGVRVHPASGDASEEVAEIMQGLIRSIENDSKAEAVYDNAFQGAVVGGRGWMRVCSEYVNDEGFEQKLVIKPILDPNTVYADLDYQQPDGSDRNFVFVTEEFYKDEFEKRWPKAEPISWDGGDIPNNWTPGKDKIIVADYYRRVCTVRTKVRMSDGLEGWKDEMPPKEAWPIDPNTGAQVTIAKEREVEIYSVEWYKIAGGQQVLDKYDWPGTVIPVVCTTGDDLMLEGKRVYQGLTRHARDAQAMLNFGMTQQAIHLSLTPRAPWLATAEQISGYENIWKEANTKNFSYLPWNAFMPDGTTPTGPPPSRTAPSLPDAGQERWCQTMIQMIRSTIGMYEQSLGMKGQEHSGKAIIAREKQGDNATFNYTDNLARAIGLIGFILVECIPSFYDTERIIHIIGPDDVRKEVKINQTSATVEGGAFQAIAQNNLKTGKYAITVESGPNFATKRQETAEALTSLVSAFPPLMEIAGDLVVKAQDIPDADVIAKRMKLMLPAPIQAAEAAEKEGRQPPDPQVQAQMQEQQKHLDQAAQTMQAMEQEINSLKSGAQQKMAAAQLDAQLQQEKMDRETAYKQMELEANIRQKQIEAEIAAQSAIEQANREAQLAIEKANIDAATRIRVAMIDRMTKLEIAEMDNETKQDIANTHTEPDGDAD